MPNPITTDIIFATCITAGTSPVFSISVISNGPTDTCYQCQLYKGSQTNPLQTAVGSPTTPTANRNLNWSYATQVGGSGLTTPPYFLAVRACNSAGGAPGPWSQPLMAVYITVALSQVAFDGEQVTLQWSQSDALAGPAQGFEVYVIDANAAQWPSVILSYPGLVTKASGSPARSGVFDINFSVALASQPLTLNFTPYSQTALVGPVSGQIGTCYGPTTTEPFFVAQPSIASAVASTTTANTYALTIPNVFGSATSVALQATLTVGGASYTGATLSTPTVATDTVTTTLTLPTGLPPGAPVAATLTQYDGAQPSVSSGPAGPPHTLVTVTPAVAGASFTAPTTHGGVGSLALALAYPPAAPALAAAQVSIVNSEGAAVCGPTVVSGDATVLAPTLTAGTAYFLALQGAAGADLGPQAARVPVLTAAPVLTTVAYDGQVASASWSAAAGAGVTGYMLSVGSGGQTAAQVALSGLSGEVALPVGATGLALSVAAFGASAVFGPPTGAVTLLTEKLSIAAVTTDPITGLATASWTDPANNTGYLLQIYQNGAPNGAPITVSGATQYSFTAPFPADSSIEIAVAPTASVTPATQTSAVAVTGPSGPLRIVPNAVVDIIDADFDGVDAYVSWTPIGGATGYTISVLTADGAAPYQPAVTAGATANARSVTLKTPIITTNTYQIVVQAQFGPDLGPPSAPAPIFVPGYYLAPSSTTAGTAIYPTTTLAQPMTATLSGLGAVSPNIVCYLPALSAGTVGSVAAAGPFSLAAYTGAGSAAYPFQLTIGGGATSEAWTFSGAAIRTQLQADYVTFLKNAEGAGVSPYGVFVIQQAIARLMPQTFAETLYYAYGLNLIANATAQLPAGTVDLRPGTILRVMSDPYQYIPPGAAGTASSGFTGQAALEFEMSSYQSTAGTWAIGFDAFVAQLVAANALTVTAPQLQNYAEQPVADPADLFFPTFQQPFYRLFAPSELLVPWETGSDMPASNMAIAAAASFTAMTTATNTTGGTASALAYFAGRAVARLCIRVNVAGSMVVVPIGTTVGNLLETMALRPLSTGVGLTGLTLTRSLGGAVTTADSSYAIDAPYRVRFDWQSLSIYGFAADALDLPLLHGDCLTLGG